MSLVETPPLLFVSYSIGDDAVVHEVVDATRREGVRTWIAPDDLLPGTNWLNEIIRSMDQADAALVFLSDHSASSDHVREQIKYLATLRKPMFVVRLERARSLSPGIELLLTGHRTMDLPGGSTASDIKAIATEISTAARRLASSRTSPRPSAPRAQVSGDVLNEAFANSLATAARGTTPHEEDVKGPPRSVFLVHGHDSALLAEVEEFVRSLGVETIVLKRIQGPSQSLLQKFFRWGQDTRFALVLLTADDLGVSRVQYDTEGVGDRALQFRARQNVILELGFFYGRLGWENVFVLYQPPGRTFPNFERPSDLDGVVFDWISDDGRWRDVLRDKLRDAGFQAHRS